MREIEAIKKVLGEQLLGCRQLLEILQKEKLCLLDLKMEKVEAIIKEKDILVLKLKLLEEERKRLLEHWLQKNISNPLIQENEPFKVTLLKLAELTKENVFLEIRSKLISLSQSIKELNDFNKMMIDRTLGFLKKNTLFLEPFYNQTVPLGGKGGLLSKEM